MAISRQWAGRTILRFSGILSVLLLWEIAPRLGWVDSQFLPPLSVVLATIRRLSQEGTLSMHLGVSLWRIIASLLVAALIAVPSGLALGGWLTCLARRLEPLLRILGQVNPFSLMPVFMLFFGLGEKAKVAVLVWVCVWPILHNTVAGVRSIDPVLTKSALVMGISRRDFLVRVLLPGAAHSTFVGIRTATGLAFFTLIAAEMIGASAGLGWFMHNAASLYQVPRIYAAGLFIVTLGVAINRGLLFLERGIFAWEENRSIAGSDPEPGRTRVIGGKELAALAALVAGIFIFGSHEVAMVNAREASFTTHAGQGAHGGHAGRHEQHGSHAYEEHAARIDNQALGNHAHDSRGAEDRRHHEGHEGHHDNQADEEPGSHGDHVPRAD